MPIWPEARHVTAEGGGRIEQSSWGTLDNAGGRAYGGGRRQAERQWNTGMGRLRKLEYDTKDTWNTILGTFLAKTFSKFAKVSRTKHRMFCAYRGCPSTPGRWFQNPPADCGGSAGIRKERGLAT